MNNNIDFYIGKQIRSRRKICKISQAILGEMIGVSFQQIQKYEKGLNKISACKLYDISLALKVKINYFFDGFKKEEENNSIAEEQKEFTYSSSEYSYNDALMNIFKKIEDPETKEKLLLFLETLTKE